MGAETGLKVSMGEEAKSDSTQARRSDVEVAHLNGLRNRKETKAKGSASIEAMRPPNVVGHYHGSGNSYGGWIARIAALLVGEDPSQSYALICGNCHMHNGLARKEDFPHVTYYCPHCHALNMSNQSIGQCPGANSGQLNPGAPADRGSSAHPNPIAETELSCTTNVQDLPEEENTGKQPVESANSGFSLKKSTSLLSKYDRTLL